MMIFILIKYKYIFINNGSALHSGCLESAVCKMLLKVIQRDDVSIEFIQEWTPSSLTDFMCFHSNRYGLCVFIKEIDMYILMRHKLSFLVPYHMTCLCRVGGA